MREKDTDEQTERENEREREERETDRQTQRESTRGPPTFSSNSLQFLVVLASIHIGDSGTEKQFYKEIKT